MIQNTNSTIVARATAAGEAAIAMVRVSGPEALPLAREIFGRRSVPARRALKGDYRAADGTALDETLFTFFPKPRSYTGEDILEISCHGSPLIVQRILDDLLRRGCRMAEPGEFTRLAFLNGKMDLTQAEAVIDLIRARSDRALEAAQRQMRGALGSHARLAVDSLLLIIANIEAHIDFPDEDLPAEDNAAAVTSIQNLLTYLGKLAATSRYGAILREGVKTVILGAPNAGKSSLLNQLVGRDRVIVSDEPGTTRDAVEEAIAVGPHCIRIIDTAGIRPSASRLEILSMTKTMEQVDGADLLLLLLDATLPHPSLPGELIERMRPDNTIIVYNKMDLIAGESVPERWPGELPEVFISALTGAGVDRLRDRLLEMIEAHNPFDDEDVIAISARHAQALQEAIEGLRKALEMLRDGEPSELVASELRGSLHAMGNITGQTDTEAVLDKLFATFCIGK